MDLLIVCAIPYLKMDLTLTGLVKFMTEQRHNTSTVTYIHTTYIHTSLNGQIIAIVTEQRICSLFLWDGVLDYHQF